MTPKEYKKQFKEDQPVGWLAIDDALASLYPITELRHYPPLCGLHYMAGGTDPIDGASIYDSTKQAFHRHIISYGMSELYYDEEKAGQDFSKWGFEFTFRIKPFEEDQKDPLWAVHVMNNLARYVFSSGNWFDEYHFVPANGPIRANTNTAITGLIFVMDPELGTIETPHGAVKFLQMVGITQSEVDQLGSNPSTLEVEQLVNELRKSNPLLITDLTRK